MSWCCLVNKIQFLPIQYAYQVERIESPKLFCGEAPHYDADRNCLYYVDIANSSTTSSILRYDLKENKVYRAFFDGLDGVITFIFPIKCTADQFLISVGRKGVIVQWDGVSPKGKILKEYFAVERGYKYRNDVFNDGKTDPCGRFYGGTKITESCDAPIPAIGSLFEKEKGKRVKRVIPGVIIGNGLTWIGKKFYYVDSCTYDVKVYDYNRRTGDLC